MRQHRRADLFLVALGLFALSCGDYKIFHHQPGQPRSALQILLVAQDPAGPLVYQKTGTHFRPLSDAVITEADLHRVATDTLRRGGCDIEITFTPTAAKRVETFTADKAGQLLAIVIDGKVVSAPQILGTLGARVQLTGFSCREADTVASSIAP